MLCGYEKCLSFDYYFYCNFIAIFMLMNFIKTFCPLESKFSVKSFSRNFSWNWFHGKTFLFKVDQPAGTGFSSGSYVHNENGVQEDFYAFLEEFYKQLPQYKNNSLYITGKKNPFQIFNSDGAWGKQKFLDKILHLKNLHYRWIICWALCSCHFPLYLENE